MVKKKQSTGRLASPAAHVLPGFEPLAALWQGENAVYESDQQVRWLIRKHGERLANAEAVALLGRHIYVHRERFLQVMREHALAAGRERYAASHGQ